MATGDTETCCIWGTAAVTTPRGDSYDVDSPRAGGLYTITGTAAAMIQTRDDVTKLRLTTWLVDQRCLGVDRPQVNLAVLEAVLTTQALGIDERLNRLLRLLNRLAGTLGELVPFAVLLPAEILYGDGYTRVGAAALAHTGSQKPTEVMYLLGCLKEMELIEWPLPGSQAQITYKGYARLAELQARAVDSRQAFVAMWFDDSLASAYDDGIRPAISDAGYVPLRIDRKDHIKKIDDEIVAEIRRSRFVIADFTQGDTGARGGVYYEAGFAHGLNVPVIFCCQEESLGSVHFDTRQYSHIVWKTPDDLRKQLARRISAVIGDGPFKHI